MRYDAPSASQSYWVEREFARQSRSPEPQRHTGMPVLLGLSLLTAAARWVRTDGRWLGCSARCDRGGSARRRRARCLRGRGQRVERFQSRLETAADHGVAYRRDAARARRRADDATFITTFARALP